MKSKNDALLDWRREVAASSTIPHININNNKKYNTTTVDSMNKVHFADSDESIGNGVDDDDDDVYNLDYEYPPSNSSYYNYNEGGSSIGRDRSASALGGSSIAPLRKQNNHLHPFQNGANSTNNMINNNSIRNNLIPHNDHNNNKNISHGSGGLLPKVSFLIICTDTKTGK